MHELPAIYKNATRDLLDALSWRVTNKNYKSIKELDGLETRLQRITAVVRGKRNALLPINKLPTELLVMVFLYAQEHLDSFLPTPLNGTAYDKDHLHWLSLLHVCRHWRGIAATSSSLWSTVDNGVMPEKFLKRSGNMALTIYCGIRTRSYPKADLQLYLPHLPRMRELHLDVSKWNQSMQSMQELCDLLSDPAPLLESLTIDTVGAVSGPPSGILPAVFGGKTPLLRKLCLEYFSYWAPGHFRGLTHLCLHHQPFPETLRPTTAQFLDYLDACPDLEELVLVSAGPTRSEADDGPSTHPDRLVVLSKLRELTIGKVNDLTTVRRLLSYLSLPNSTRMYFWGCPVFGNDGDIANLIPANLTNLPCMTGMEEWRLRSSPYHTFPTGRDNYIVAFVDKVLYTLDIGLEVHLARMPTVYAPILHDVQRVYVSDTLDISTSLWQDLFCCLPKMTDLVLKPHPMWNASRGILAALYPEPVTQEKAPVLTGLKGILGIDGLLCPDLTRLSFEVFSGVQGPGFYISTLTSERKNRGKPLELLELKYLRTPISIPSPQSTPPPLPPNQLAPTPGPGVPQPAPPPAVVVLPVTSQGQTHLEMESMRVATATVTDVRYLYEQEPCEMEPKEWPTRGYIWTTMALPESD